MPDVSKGPPSQSPRSFCPQTPHGVGRQAGKPRVWVLPARPQVLPGECKALPFCPLPTLRGLFSGEGGDRRAKDSRLQIKGRTSPAPCRKLRQTHEPGSHSSPPRARQCQGWGLREPAANTKRLQRTPRGGRRGSTQSRLGRDPAARLPCHQAVPVPQWGLRRSLSHPNMPGGPPPAQGTSPARTEASQLQSSSCQLLPPGTRAHQATEDTPSSQGVWAWLRPSRKTAVPSQVAIPFVGRVPLPSYTPQAGGAVAEVAHLFGGARVGVRARCSPAHVVSGRVSVCPCALSGTACPPVLAQARHACGVQPRESVGDSQRSRHT